jgi:hypothetical protein
MYCKDPRGSPLTQIRRTMQSLTKISQPPSHIPCWIFAKKNCLAVPPPRVQTVQWKAYRQIHVSRWSEFGVVRSPVGRGSEFLYVRRRFIRDSGYLTGLIGDLDLRHKIAVGSRSASKFWVNSCREGFEDLPACQWDFLKYLYSSNAVVFPVKASDEWDWFPKGDSAYVQRGPSSDGVFFFDTNIWNILRKENKIIQELSR